MEMQRCCLLEVMSTVKIIVLDWLSGARFSNDHDVNGMDCFTFVCLFGYALSSSYILSTALPSVNWSNSEEKLGFARDLQ